MKKKRVSLLQRATRNTAACLGILLCTQAVYAQDADTLKTNGKSAKRLVAFGAQRNEQVLGAYGTVDGKSLESVPVAQLEQTLYGKLAGLNLWQSSGKPGADQAGIYLRDEAPLIVIDGVPRSYLSIDPQQVESVTVLKDALSTAMYGMRGANGVLYIKTRQGSDAPKRISFTAQTAIQQQLRTPKFVNAYQYASLFNEALQNDGKSPVYSATDLQKYKDHSSPYTHPDVDWYNTILKDQATMQRYNLNISGGTKMARYFVDLDYLNQQGFFITDSKNTYPTNNYYKRYVFRSNIDADLTKSTLFSINLFGRIRNGNEPGATTSSIYNNLLLTPNNAYPVTNPNGTLGGNQQYVNNLYGQVLRSGYRPSVDRNLGVDISLRQDLSTLTKGLYAKVLGSFNSYYAEAIDRSKSFSIYNFQLTPPNNDTSYQKIGTDVTQNNATDITSQNRQIYTELSLGYERRFGSHEVGAEVMYNHDDVVMTDLPLDNSTIASRLQYNYNRKYFIEFAGAYSGLNRYPQGKRWGFFPSAGIGWNMSEESWFKKAVPVVSYLKWRASYGMVGDNSLAGNFRYKQSYVNSSTAYFQNPSTSASSLIEATLANPNITWEKVKKFNAGVDVAMLRGKLEFSLDYYNHQYYDQLQQRNTNASDMLGVTLPLENIGKTRYSGLELQAAYHAKTGKVNWFARVNASLSASKIIFMDEVRRPYDYQRRTGGRVGQPFGLTAIGFYQSQAEINASPAIEGYKPVPGDIKYKDVNGDGIINVFDETAIGNTKPLFAYGVTTGLSWNGIDFSMVWQGVANTSVFTNLPGSLSFQLNANGGYGQAYEQSLNRWTPATAATATYPRLTLGANTNNDRASTFWLKNGNYLRLKNVELGYSLPQKWIHVIRLQKVRAFVNAYNLLTFTCLENVDPEVVQWGYPNQRVINFGINIQF